MKCPVCDVQLSISSREGVEIDFCPQCRGVWLDRGELDKILERAATVMSPDPVPSGRGRDDWSEPRYENRYDRDRDRDRDYDDDRRSGRDYDDDDHRLGRGGKRRKKRGSFLEDLFEFGGD